MQILHSFSNLLKSVLHCFFSVNQFEKFINSNQSTIDEFKEIKEMFSNTAMGQYHFGTNLFSFLQKIQFPSSYLYEQGMNSTAYLLIKKIMFYLNRLYRNSNNFDPKTDPPFQIYHLKTLNFSRNIPILERRYLKEFVFYDFGLLNRTYIFPEDFHLINPSPGDNLTNSNVSKMKLPVYKCRGTIILRILGQAGTRKTGKSNFFSTKRVIFTPSNVMNGIIHPNLGRLIIKSALAYYSDGFDQGYCSLIKTGSNYTLHLNGQYRVISVDELAMNPAYMLLFVFFEVDDSQ